MSVTRKQYSQLLDEIKEVIDNNDVVTGETLPEIAEFIYSKLPLPGKFALTKDDVEECIISATRSDRLRTLISKDREGKRTIVQIFAPTPRRRQYGRSKSNSDDRHHSRVCTSRRGHGSHTANPAPVPSMNTRR